MGGLLLLTLTQAGCIGPNIEGTWNVVAIVNGYQLPRGTMDLRGGAVTVWRRVEAKSGAEARITLKGNYTYGGGTLELDINDINVDESYLNPPDVKELGMQLDRDLLMEEAKATSKIKIDFAQAENAEGVDSAGINYVFRRAEDFAKPW